MKKTSTLLLLSILTMTALTGCGNKDNLTPIKDTITTELGDELKTEADAYVTATDDILKETKVDVSKVDITKVGSYEMTVTHEKEVETIKVKVEDTTAPTASVSESIVVGVNTPYDLSTIVTDVVEYSNEYTLEVKDHTYTVPAENSTEGVESTEISTETPTNTTVVNYDTAGEYDNSVTLTDASNNKTEYPVHIVVINMPTITGTKDVTVEEGSSLDFAKGVTATDGLGTDITANLTVNSEGVDLKNPGEYSVTYSVTDQYGFSSSLTTKVTVTEKKKVEKPKTNTSTSNGSSNNGTTASNNTSSSTNSNTSTPSGAAPANDISNCTKVTCEYGEFWVDANNKIVTIGPMPGHELDFNLWIMSGESGYSF